MTSPCETTAYTASVAEPGVPLPHGVDGRGPACRASTRRRRRGTSSPTGATARPSTAGPWPASSARRRSSRRSGTSPTRSSTCRSTGVVPGEHQVGRLQAALQRAGDRPRPAAPAASRAASAVTCARPASSRPTPSVQPASTPAPLAVVRPWRTSRTVVTPQELYGGHNDRRDRRLRPLPPRRARGVARGLLPTRSPRPGRRAASFIWIGLHDPTEDELDKVAAEFGCTSSRSRTRSRPTSGPRSRSTTTRCSSSSRRSATTRTRSRSSSAT